MNLKNSKFFLLILSSLCLMNCGGTHGKIASYHFRYSYTVKGLLSIVDQFLLANPDYYNHVDETSGWVYIKVPPEDDKFGFRIGGKSEIVLISAGRQGEITRWSNKINEGEQKRFIQIFEEKFINRLRNYSPREEKILESPFIFSANIKKDTLVKKKPWPHYVFQNDTLLSSPLPSEFDDLPVDFFSNLISAFSAHTNQDIKVVQYQNLFRIDSDYSGHLSKDSIFITAKYRTVGERKQFYPFFNQPAWSDFVSDRNKELRILSYEEIRLEKTKKGYKEEGSVYNEIFEEVWMVGHESLNKVSPLSSAHRP